MTRERLHRLFVAEEVASVLRHRLVNKVAAVGALNFHLKRQLAAWDAPPAVTSVPALIDGEVAQASVSLDLHFLPPVLPAEATAGAAIAAVVESVARPVTITGDGALRIAIAPLEL